MLETEPDANSGAPNADRNGENQSHAPDGPEPAEATLAPYSGRPLKRSFQIAGHRTSISLEPAFWDAFRALADKRAQSMSALLKDIDRRRGDMNLSSAVRTFVLTAALDGVLTSEAVAAVRQQPGSNPPRSSQV